MDTSFLKREFGRVEAFLRLRNLKRDGTFQVVEKREYEPL